MVPQDGDVNEQDTSANQEWRIRVKGMKITIFSPAHTYGWVRLVQSTALAPPEDLTALIVAGL